jgi:hypothetical protein
MLWFLINHRDFIFTGASPDPQILKTEELLTIILKDLFLAGHCLGLPSSWRHHADGEVEGPR